MKTRVSHLHLLLLAAACAVSASAFAQVNVLISGEIQPATCTPNMTGIGVTASSITLPPVSLSALDGIGKTAGPRTVTFSLPAGCDVSQNNMWVHFNSGQVEAGRIVSSNPQVHFEIRNDTETGAQVFAGGTALNTGPNSNQGTAASITGAPGNRMASKDYVLRYYANQVVSQAGSITANATYTVKYY